ncbi:hypothetical protein P153DRAFT_399992 [Dothidotthia symphoricarpi CBS 119687]|uniref:DUF7726 domain-containing protein n=1 Tax=Dothidotthia symphoricarpi CBS 119687 TaxID=1392245 RepID=A0A6A6A3U8_9PLEO|nr:uncharacterized protein P153DRAFT_399992 [Dothidotthia symphoricarpi CBS 119687]KAF2125855.1 hypothetical protein P153DRAFT_399992 [Dothidotthia symphoricarpi CBS 119687]
MTKRSSDVYLAMGDEELDEQIEDMAVTDSCDVVRRKIRTFLDNGEMKVGEFQKEIGVNSKGYSMFMNQNGRDKGSGSSVYTAAWAFFKKRELRGIKMKPNKKVKTADEGDAVPSVDGVEIEGEKEDKVPVFDTCDEVRRKINLHLKKPGVTQAAFLREVAAQYHTTPPKKIQSKQLNDFRSKHGAWEGNTSSVFYGAYVYFEKLRIKEGKPKGKKREEMEGIWGKEGGLDTKSRREYFTCLAGERPVMDAHGRVSFG